MTDGTGETRSVCSSSPVPCRPSGTESDRLGNSVIMLSPPEDDE